MTKFELFKAMFRHSEWNFKSEKADLVDVSEITHEKTQLCFFTGCGACRIRDKESRKIIHDFGFFHFILFCFPAACLEYRLRKQGIES